MQTIQSLNVAAANNLGLIGSYDNVISLATKIPLVKITPISSVFDSKNEPYSLDIQFYLIGTFISNYMHS